MLNEVPKVSCLMVTADRKRFVKRSLLSYRRQTYPNKELIIVDDGKEELEELLAGFPPQEITYLKIEKKPENVLGYLRNITLENATGEFITQWDDDDWYHPDRIRAQAEALLKGYEMCCLSHTLMHLDTASFFEHPYISYFLKGVPGSIMHRRNSGIRYPEIALGEDDVFMKAWKEKPHIKLDRSFACLFIRCYHGENSWDMKHFLEQMRNTLPDLVSYGWLRYVRKDLFKHKRFKLDEASGTAFKLFLEDSYSAGLFRQSN